MKHYRDLLSLFLSIPFPIQMLLSWPCCTLLQRLKSIVYTYLLCCSVCVFWLSCSHLITVCVLTSRKRKSFFFSFLYTVFRKVRCMYTWQRHVFYCCDTLLGHIYSIKQEREREERKNDREKEKSYNRNIPGRNYCRECDKFCLKLGWTNLEISNRIQPMASNEKRKE